MMALVLAGTMILTAVVWGSQADSASDKEVGQTEEYAAENAAGEEIMEGTEEDEVSGSLDGGYEINSGSVALEDNEDAMAAFEKATEGLDGCEYEPIAILGTQVVAGTNYAILCRMTEVLPDAEPELGIVYIYEDLEGNAEISEVVDLAL